MKKIILAVLGLISFNLGFSQDISMNPKVAKAQGPSGNFMLEAKSIFTNNSNDSAFEWNILEIQMTTGWEFGMCDPFNCLTGLIVGNKGSFSLGKGKSGEFKGDFVPNGNGGSGKAKVHVYAKSNPNNDDTVEFQITGWATGLKENLLAKEFSFYPNPAKDRLNIKFNTRDAVAIDIYNVLGTKVKSFNHIGSESEFNISDLQNGIYFIRYKNGAQTISKPFTKSE
jgi:hypothetical protein